jgi:ribose/xylose/arabinose/galactoside ABC-type transport system permease subunit
MKWRAYGPLGGLILAWLFFAMLCGSPFSGLGNQRLMLLQTAVVGMAAVGATFVILSGGIDLAVGSMIALSTMVLAWLLKEGGLPPLAAALGALAAGAAVGALTGWGVNLGLTPFIATLGTWGALRGLAKGLGHNQPIYPAQTWLSSLMQGGSALAPGVWITVAAALAGSLALRYSLFCRHVKAVGSNERTARLCGVRVPRIKLGVYVLASTLGAMAGILQFAFLYGQGDPSTAEGYELKVIAAVVVGGASLSGGRGTVLGTMLGSLLMTVVDNGCTKLGLDNWVQEVVTGGIIVSAVGLDLWRRRKGEKA